jgi:hypothetical protein
VRRLVLFFAEKIPGGALLKLSNIDLAKCSCRLNHLKGRIECAAVVAPDFGNDTNGRRFVG